MLKKLIVVYNPRSSKHAAVAREVLTPARKLSGWLVGKYEVKKCGLDENAAELAKILGDGDLVIAAGGDGTAAMAANGVMKSGKDVTLGVLGYGNFNDLARMLKTKRAVEYGGEYIGGVSEIVERFEAGKVKEIFPLEVVVDGEHWRYAPCYLSLGLFAESAAVFDEPKVRKKLNTGRKHSFFSVWTLAKWYFRNRKREFLPAGEIKTRREVVEAKPKREEASKRAKETEGKKNDSEKKGRVKKVAAASKADVKLERELELVKTEQKAEKKKFKKLLRVARRQQLLEMKAGAQEKMLKASTQTKAKLTVATTEVQTKLLNAKIKTQDKMAEWGEKAREKRGRNTPEIIIEGVETVEQKKKKDDKKKVEACAVEKAESGRFKEGATDYMAVNGPSVAKMMRGGKYYRKKTEFWSTTMRIGSFWRLMGFMACSILLHVPGQKTRGDVIKFRQRGNVMIQAEGEYEMLTGVKKIEVRKAKRGLKVVGG